MKCYKHNNSDAVWTCKDCWIWLCVDCINKYSFPICNSCNIKRFESERETIKNNMGKYLFIWLWIILFLIIWILTKQWPSPELDFYWKIQLIIFFYCIIFIWFWLEFINSLKDPNTITIRTNEWIFVFIVRKTIKYVFAWIIWWFVWPYQVYKMKKRIIEINNNISNIQTNL